MILLLLSVLFLLWLVRYKMKRRRMMELAASIPASVQALPGIGIAHKLCGTTEETMKAIQGFSYEAMKEGIIKAWLGPNLYFVMVDPVDIEYVLKICLEKDDLYRFLKNIIGNGLVASGVKIWKKRRKILVPAFSPKVLDNFAKVFSEQSEKLAKDLQSKAGQGSLSLLPFITNYTLGSVTETVMGIKQDKLRNCNSYSQFLDSLKIMANLMCERISHVWLHPDWLFKLFPQSKLYVEHTNRLLKFTDEMIQQKREDMKLEKNNKLEWDNDDYLETVYGRQILLDLLIMLSTEAFNDEKGYTDIELREEVLTLTIASTDTSALTTEFTLLLLAKYPEVQEKVYQELLEVFGDSDRELVKEDLVHLKYLDRVVKESLRLCPPAPIILRKVLKEIKLPSGRILPADCGVAVSIWGVHRDSKYWGPDAECFDPDRFLPERFHLDHSSSYMPFSNGPRNCVGYQYALMLVKIALASVVRRFKVVGEPEKSSTPTIRVKLDVMMKAVDGHLISLEKRK